MTGRWVECVVCDVCVICVCVYAYMYGAVRQLIWWSSVSLLNCTVNCSYTCSDTFHENCCYVLFGSYPFG